MKNWNKLFNPFTRIAGWQAFLIGLTIAVITSLIASFSRLAFDGVLDAHSVENITIKASLILLLINLISTVFIFYLAAFIISGQTRFIDILGTMTLARAPLILEALSAFLITPVTSSEVMKNPMILFSQPGFPPFIVITILVYVWFITLSFNAFKISTGAKGLKLTLTFIFAFLAAEILSKILIRQALQASILLL